MAPLSTILKRASDTSASSKMKIGSISIPIYALVGIGITVLALIGLGIWLTVKLLRRRAVRKREDNRGSAFLTVKGVVKESSFGVKSTGFSRANLTPSVVMPDKTIIRPDATRDEIVGFYTDQGKLPRPFAPFSFALNASHAPTPSSPSSSTKTLDKRVSTDSFSASAARVPAPSSRSRSSTISNAHDSIRESFFGGKSRSHRESGMSIASRLSALSAGTSSYRNSLSPGAGVQQRPVRQVFTPILPDELTLALGERVSVLRSFDDGWCIVARPKPFSANGDAELGAVPAWCFVKPMKGLRSERPVRSSSLGVTVQMENEDKPRDDIISWSNF